MLLKKRNIKKKMNLSYLSPSNHILICRVSTIMIAINILLKVTWILERFEMGNCDIHKFLHIL